MYGIFYTGQFRKDLKLIKKRSSDSFVKLKNVVKTLESGGHLSLPASYKKHKLTGNYDKHWECHIHPDLLLIWLQNDGEKQIVLVRAGSHADLF
jgi:mRNA interferase YafQ